MVKNDDEKVTKRRPVRSRKNTKERNTNKERKEHYKLEINNDDKKVEHKKANTFSNLEVYVIMIICLALGLTIGIFINGYRGNDKKAYDSSKEVVDIYNDIKDNSYNGVGKNFNKEQTKAMIDSLEDPYAVYYEDYYAARHREELENAFIGIGTEVRIEENGDIIFTKIFDGLPAEQSGILENDKLIKIEDIPVDGMCLDESVNLIRGGSVGDKVQLTVLRDNEEYVIELSKEVITFDTVTLNYLEDDVALIKIDYFSKTTFDEVKNKLDTVKKKKINKVIMDLRDNNRGYMNIASDIASLFLDNGTVIYKEETNKGITEIKSKNNKAYNFELVILTNSGTYKAAEMLVSSLKENIGVKVIGNSTGGDSSIQTSRELENGDIIEFTTGRWLSPNGKDVRENVITPDYEVSSDEDIYVKAVNVLNSNNL